MKEYIHETKKWIIVVLVGVLSYWLLNNLYIIGGTLRTMLVVFLPFILGIALAFILNIPMKKIEEFLKKHNKRKISNKIIRIIAIICSLLIFIIIILFIAFLLIPELIQNLELLLKNIPSYIDKVEEFILDLLNKYPDVQEEIKELFSSNGNVGNIISTILNYFVNGAFGFISNLVSGFITFFTAMIFAIYMLSQKEYLIKGVKKIIFALFNQKWANKILEVATLTNKTFSKFISGQCVEAIILGLIIFVISVIFRFPYALIIAVLTAVTALIPIFGAFIAMLVGAILIGITKPIQALIFIIAFLVVQQIEGNLIYPKVVGASVGLSPLLTLLAITVGGNLFGIAGMLIGLPLASVIYSLIKSFINNRLERKKLNVN